MASKLAGSLAVILETVFSARKKGQVSERCENIGATAARWCYATRPARREAPQVDLASHVTRMIGPRSTHSKHVCAKNFRGDYVARRREYIGI